MVRPLYNDPTKNHSWRHRAIPKKLICAAALLAALSSLAQADGPYRNPDNMNPNDAGEGPTRRRTKCRGREITQSLDRIRGYLDSVTPTRVVHKQTGAAITDMRTPVADAIVEPSKGDFGIMVYEMGVVHAGLLRAREVTGDKRFTDMTERHLNSSPTPRPTSARRNSGSSSNAPTASRAS